LVQIQFNVNRSGSSSLNAAGMPMRSAPRTGTSVKAVTCVRQVSLNGRELGTFRTWQKGNLSGRR